MSVWKRRCTLKDGTESESWIADYYDADGDRHIKSFKTKKAATEYHAKVTLDLKDGVHVAVRKSVSVKDAAESWLRSADNDGLERATVEQYREHVDRHIVPIIGTLKLSNLNIPTVRNFEDKLREKGGIGAATVRKVMTSLGSILADAQEQGLCAHNAVRDLSKKRRRGKKERVEQRHKGKLKVGVHIPTLEEARAVIANAKARWRPLLIVATFTGLRASELRGLRWCDIDLEGRMVHVRQRADRFNEIGSPKSESSARSVPFGTFVADTLRAWRLLRESHRSSTSISFSVTAMDARSRSPTSSIAG